MVPKEAHHRTPMRFYRYHILDELDEAGTKEILRASPFLRPTEFSAQFQGL